VVFQEIKKQTSLPTLEPKEVRKTTVSPSKKRRPSSALGQCTEKDDFHFLDQWQQVVVLRLCMGHNQLNAQMFKKMKLEPSPICNCGLDDQMAEHILQRCPLL